MNFQRTIINVICVVILRLLFLPPAVMAFTSASINLAWDAESDPMITGYRLHYGESPGQYTATMDAQMNTQASVPSLKPGATYYFVVTAYTADGVESSPSDEVSAQTASNPLQNTSGLFTGMTDSSQQGLAFFEIVVSAGNSFTGRVLMDGEFYSLKGLLAPNGTATVAARPARPGLASRAVTVQPDGGGTGLIVTISSAGGDLTAAATKSPFGKNNAAPQAGTYTIRIGTLAPNPAGPTDVPGGWGFGRAVIAKTGAVLITGVLADAKSFSASSSIDGSGKCVIDARISGDATEVFAGQLLFRDTAGVSDGDGIFNWKKDDRPHATFSRGGLDGTVAVQLSALKPFRSKTVPKTAFAGSVTAGDLPPAANSVAFDLAFSNGAELQVKDPNPFRVSLQANGATGLINGRLLHPVSKRWRSIRGVLFQKDASGEGFFPGISSVGGFELQNVPAAP